MTDSEALVFVVDDDDSVRKALARLMRSVGLNVETFGSAGEFLAREPHPGPACLILDVRMPGLSGLDLQKELAASGSTLSVVFMTGHGTIPMSVQAMKDGAVEFLEKPFDDQTLIDAVREALKKNQQARQKKAELREILERVNSLTPRERGVFELVVSGKLNKQIAFELGTSEKTVKAQRSQIMKKMHADSLAHLVQLAVKVGIKTTVDQAV
jgi:FixJ family two-component response regulator